MRSIDLMYVCCDVVREKRGELKKMDLEMNKNGKDYMGTKFLHGEWVRGDMLFPVKTITIEIQCKKE